MRTASAYGKPMRVLEAVESVNDAQKQVLGRKVIKRFGEDLSGKTFGIWGLAFKPNTDDMREAPSLGIIAGLQAGGAKIRAFDPEGMDEAKALLDGVEWCEDAYDAVTGAEALTIVTEWNEFRALDLERVKSLMKSPVMVDLRNIYDPDEMAAAGFRYTCVGRARAVSE